MIVTAWITTGVVVTTLLIVSIVLWMLMNVLFSSSKSTHKRSR
jgi:hypothetical protein